MKSAVLVSIVGWLGCVACASDAQHHKPDDGLDEIADPTSERDAALDQSSAAVTTVGASDAAVESSTSDVDSATQDTSVDAGDVAHTSSHNPFHDNDARVTDDSVADAGSLIIEPEVEVYEPLALCAAVWELQGQVLETNLAGSVVLGDWATVQDLMPSADAGIESGSLDASVDADTGDAQVCADRFAPYLIQCEQGAIVLQSPSLVYASGPFVGGEPVTVGCWERECAVDCVPSTVESLAGVRALLSPVLPSAVPDGSVPVATGLVRINGVQVEAIATLEIIGRLE